jgi:hypothetical protein
LRDAVVVLLWLWWWSLASAQMLGSSCMSASDCASNFCEQGVCCNVSCTAVCRRCDRAGSVGTCSVDTNVPSTACGQPVAGVPCNQFLLGWNGRTCERYNRTSSGHCDATGACVRSCANLPQQTRVAHISCGHIGCVRPGTCMAGANSASSPSVSSLCFTSGTQACPPGATCDVNGDCVFESDGKGCTMDIQCASRFCVKGVCCNRACSNECEECLLGDGKCKARTGSACSFDVRCSQFVRGVSPSTPAQCQRFAADRKGLCLSTGVCGNSTDLCLGGAGARLQECGSASCRRNCDPLTLTTTVDTLAKACFVSADRAECDDIQCRNLLAGWNSADRTRCDKYDGNNNGFCDATATCATGVSLCAVPSVPRVQHVKCGANCAKAGGCAPGDSISTKGALSDICVVDAPTASCPTLSCTTVLKGWNGRTCQKYATNLPGRCDASANCQSNLSACSAVEGVQHIRCGDTNCLKNCDPGQSVSLLATAADVCQVNVTVAACPDITCSSVVKGWNGATCERFATDNTGFCDGFSECSRDFAVCQTTITAGVAVNVASRCGSAECRRPGGCAPLSPIASSNSLLAVCDVSRENKACPVVPCSQRVAGWAGASCMRYAQDSFGFCDETATCLKNNECNKLFANAKTPLVSCGSPGCVRPTGVRREQRVDVVGQHRQGVLHRQPAQRLPDGRGVRRHWLVRVSGRKRKAQRQQSVHVGHSMRIRRVPGRLGQSADLL